MIITDNSLHSITFTIAHPLGLHLRKSRDFVNVANQFDASISVQNLSHGTLVADACSIIQLMQLQAREGHRMSIQAEGPDAEKALEALQNLLVS
ncbi:MAG: HPr family phosphocarrier protein [Chloroflexota bacterium]